jgi:hypothetical protein
MLAWKLVQGEMKTQVQREEFCALQNRHMCKVTNCELRSTTLWAYSS